MKKRYGKTGYSYTGISVLSTVLLIICGIAAAVYRNAASGFAGAAAGIVLLCVLCILVHKRKELMRRYLQIIAHDSGAMSANSLGRLPIPMIIVNVDGTIKWYNEKFSDLFDNRDMFGSLFESVISEIKWNDIGIVEV